ncbi:MAG: zinc ribbon domain-containing protein [Oscillospiraceae bacterium]|nr:zinc ribbon domain-containing protein [Oscillospiraceae bacterium]
MKCPSCGAELEKDARFCHICGQPVPAAGEESRFCIRCGAKLPAGAAFCARCGAAVSGSHARQTPEAAPRSKSAPQPVSTSEGVTEPDRTAKAAPVPQGAEETAPRPAEEKKTKKSKKSKRSGSGGALVLVLLILALLFGAVCAFLYAESYTRGISVKEYITSLGSKETDGEQARWSDLKQAEPPPAPDGAAEQQDGVGTKEVCALYIQLLEGRREAIERYSWQRTADGVARPIVLCDIWGDNQPELIWVEATNEENVSASTLNIAAIRDGAAAILCSESWDVQAGGGFRYYLFQKEGSKALYAFSAYGEETWYECYADYTGSGGDLAREELLKSVMTEQWDGENAWQSIRYTKGGAEVAAGEWLGDVESLLNEIEEILMYSADAGSFAVDFIEQHGCPAMSYDEAIKFLSDCLAAVS